MKVGQIYKKKCAYCGKEFQVNFKCLLNIRKFCSGDCYNKSTIKIYEKNCEYCGKKYIVTSKWKHKRSRFCSKNCANKGFVGKKPVLYKITCVYCRKKFMTRRGKGNKKQKFCSVKCFGSYLSIVKRKPPIRRKCSICNKYYFVETSKIKKGKKYCSRKCSGIAKRTNKKSASKSLSYGWVTSNYRALIEKKLGRKLKTTENVHHINFDRNDNRLKNLYVYSSFSEHIKGQMTIFKIVKLLLEKKIIIFKNGVYRMKGGTC